MKMNSLTLRVCLGRKRIFLARYMINQLGNPSHLSFWYDESAGKLIVSPAAKDDLDAYEIPQYFWKSGTKHSCEVARIAFLKALQYRLGWEDGGAYLFEGSFTGSGEVPAAVFNLANGNRLR